VPRYQCPEHGIHTIATPWSDKHARFTLMFEAFAIAVLQACSSVEATRGFRSFKRYRTAILFYCRKLDLLPAPNLLPQKS